MEYLVSVGEELSAEECEWLPGTMEDLFKDHANVDVAGVGGEHEGKTRRRKLEICCGGKSLFRGFEGVFLGGAPGEQRREKPSWKQCLEGNGDNNSPSLRTPVEISLEWVWERISQR